jgi:uncharacterized protein (TIGR00255 family)
MSGSMTGWGKYRTNEFNVAIRGLNSKYKEIFLHLPQELFEAEPYVYKIVNDRITRGRVDVYINLNMEKVKKRFLINDILFRDIYNILNKLYKKLKINKDIPLEYILRDVEGVATTQLDNNKITIEKVKIAVSHAIDDFEKSKIAEGLNLKKSIKNYILKIQKLTNKLNLLFSFLRKSYAEKTRKKIYELFSGEKDRKFLNLDIVAILEKYDITEEIVRLNSHIKQLLSIIKSGNSGRKIDFFAQEIYREANTITSKIQNAKITELAIYIKELSEKIREQTQNLE